MGASGWLMALLMAPCPWHCEGHHVLRSAVSGGQRLSLLMTPCPPATVHNGLDKKGIMDSWVQVFVWPPCGVACGGGFLYARLLHACMVHTVVYGGNQMECERHDSCTLMGLEFDR